LPLEPDELEEELFEDEPEELGAGVGDWEGLGRQL
jgi:hypothetical protein